MAEGMAEYEAAVAPLKQGLFDRLLARLDSAAAPGQPAHLLELGIGTGPNLPFLARHYGVAAAGGGGGGGQDGGGGGGGLPPLLVTGVDPNPFMQPYLEESAARWGWPAERLRWVEGSAEALPLPDASVDAVVCTLVLCSVEDVAAAVGEAARVLRPGGALLFIEHTVALGRPLLWAAQHALDPLQRWLADNCHLTRDPLPAIAACPGFAGGVDARRLSVEGVTLISPHVAGLAVRQA